MSNVSRDEMLATDDLRRLRHQPVPFPNDLADVRALKEWIERVRWAAFFSGARGDEISQREAELLAAALRARE
jgi:hypothetical protein